MWNCKVQASNYVSDPISTHPITMKDKKMHIDMYN